MKNNKKIYPSSLFISSIILSLCVQIIFFIIIFYFDFNLDILTTSFLNVFLIVLIFYPFLYYLIFNILIHQIKESKKIEKENMMLASVVEMSKDFIFIFEPKSGNILYLNKSAKKTLGSTKKNISEIVSKRSEKDFDLGVLQTLSDQFWKKDIYLKEINEKELMVSQTLILHKNSHLYISAVARDVRDSRMFVEQIEKHLKEQESLNEIMVGRELKMAEMKKEIKELKEKIK